MPRVAWSRYLLMQFLVNAGFGALFGLGLYWIGVPNPVLWGAVAGILRIVPYVGTAIAATMPLALSLAVFDGWLRPLLVLAVVVSLELIVGNFLEPWLYGAHVGVSSLALLVTAVFWAVLWGPAGLILSTPLTVCVVVLGRYVPHLSFLNILLGDEPVLAADAQLYQQLLAMDQLEAHTIVREFLKGRPLVELYDSVLVPALSMAEQDRHKGAIDAMREDFLFLSINEMIAEFSEYEVPESEARPANRILCIPAHDRADEITAAMLAQLLEKNGPRGTPEKRPMRDTSKAANEIRQDKVVITHGRASRQRKTSPGSAMIGYSDSTWAEDMAPQGCDQSADPAAGNAWAAQAAFAAFLAEKR
jgi:hypothetical protein